MEFQVINRNRNAVIPEGMFKLCGMEDAKLISMVQLNGGILLMPESVSTYQLLMLIDALNEQACEFLEAVAAECGPAEAEHRDMTLDEVLREFTVAVPDWAREKAGITADTKLDCEASEDAGVIAVYPASYRHDLTDVPRSILQCLLASGHSLYALNDILTAESENSDAEYGQTHEGHTAVEGQTVTKGFSYSNGKWRADDTPGPEIHVVCESTQPPTPDKPTAPSKEDLSKLEKPVEVVCTTNPTAHIAATFVLIEGTYNIGDVTGDETDGYTCDITVTADEYVTKYNTDFGAHTLSGDNTKTLTLKYVDGKWVANGTVTFNVECTEAEKHPVMLVIYRNGDTEKAYKTVALEKMPKGTVIDLTKLNIADYYTANYTGKYDFYGWYDDGLWNIYKQDLTKQLDGLTTKTVNGWTNLKCMVYDYEKVVYYMSDADRVADNRLFETTARKGAALPTADAPTATRDGYTFKFWSREGQSSNVTGQTVNGWTNLVANWKVTPHNIYAYARLNSYFAPLTTKEFDTPVTLNAATLSRLGLGSYNGLGYISIGSFDFDAVPLAGDQYFGDDAELDAVVTELAESIALENGVSEDTAEKIAWTVLYKTVV